MIYKNISFRRTFLLLFMMTLETLRQTDGTVNLQHRALSIFKSLQKQIETQSTNNNKKKEFVGKNEGKGRVFLFCFS